MQLCGPTENGLNDLGLSVEAGSSQRSGLKESGEEKWSGERLEACGWMTTFVCWLLSARVEIKRLEVEMV